MTALDPQVLAQLPRAGNRRLAVRVTPDALRQVRAGHPWVFDASVRSVSHEGSAGDLAVVFDQQRQFAAIGLWDPTSPIRIRVLHAGSPQPIDHDFWRRRLARAIDHRAPLSGANAQRSSNDAHTTGYRLAHGENDGLPGLVVDRYAETLVVKVYSSAWLAHLAAIVPLLVQLTAADRVVLRLSRVVGRRAGVQLPDGSVLAGTAPPDEVEFMEHGLRFGADVVRGQKTGHFLDQRDNRVRCGTLAARRHVLDVFSCTGGFSVHCAAGGASSVTSVDLSAHALAAAERNIRRNRDLPAVAACSHRTIGADAFVTLEALRRRRQTFDLVIVDPPSFAPNRDAVRAALAAYARLTRLALDVLTPGGVLVQASCSSRVTADDFFAAVTSAATSHGWRLAELARTQHPRDHPIGFPEGAYLKALFAEAGRA